MLKEMVENEDDLRETCDVSNFTTVLLRLLIAAPCRNVRVGIRRMRLNR